MFTKQHDLRVYAFRRVTFYRYNKIVTCHKANYFNLNNILYAQNTTPKKFCHMQRKEILRIPLIIVPCEFDRYLMTVCRNALIE